MKAKELADKVSPISENLNALEAAFIEILLKHLPALQAIMQPLPASYYRVEDGIWSGGSYICWGMDNKEVPVRLVDSHLSQSKRFEVKCIDGLSIRNSCSHCQASLSHDHAATLYLPVS